MDRSSEERKFYSNKNIVFCSRHFEECDLYIAQTDTPNIFKIRRLRKGAIPSVNLRGREQDERLLKRCSSVLRRSNTGIDEAGTGSSSSEPSVAESENHTDYTECSDVVGSPVRPVEVKILTNF